MARLLQNGPLPGPAAFVLLMVIPGKAKLVIPVLTLTKLIMKPFLSFLLSLMAGTLFCTLSGEACTSELEGVAAFHTQLIDTAGAVPLPKEPQDYTREVMAELKGKKGLELDHHYLEVGGIKGSERN